MLKPVKKTRLETFSLYSYLRRFKEDDVRGDADVQRLGGCYTNKRFNGLVVSVLTNEYIPPLILGEIPVGDSYESYIEDGLQRSTALFMFRFANKAITKEIEDSEIAYEVKKKDRKGNFILDKDGHSIKEWRVFDIKEKRFDDLPIELQQTFDNYQIGLAIHPDTTKKEISRRIRIYNDQEPMRNSQRAFTYIPSYAGYIRKILANDFYRDCIEYSDKELTNGLYEKVICETIMAIFHLDHWTSNIKSTAIYIEKNSNDKELEHINKLSIRLYNLLKDDKYKKLFSKKNTYLWTTIFNKFTTYNLPDSYFIDFLNQFNSYLGDKKIDKYEKSFNEYDYEKRTKNKKDVVIKIDMITKLMEEYFHITKEAEQLEWKISSDNVIGTDIDMTENTEDNSKSSELESVVSFVQETLSDNEINAEDIIEYEDFLEDVLKINTLLYQQCKIALIALTGYAYKIEEDVLFSEWLTKYSQNNMSFGTNQKSNYAYLKHMFDIYCKRNRGKKDDDTT